MPRAVVLAILLASTPALARDKPLERPSRSGSWDYGIAGFAGAVFAVQGLGFQWAQAPVHWTGPILFDSAVRSALRAPDGSTRNLVNDVSWAFLAAQIAYPLVVDVPYAWSRDDFGLARDLFWQDAATLFLAGAVDLTLRDVVGRARPYVYDCIKQGGTDCINNPEAVRSFPGGHTLTSTAASVLTCTQHLYMHLYGSGWDELTCALTLASDVAVAFMRVIADSHWATDQIAGATLGALIGWGVPYVMHFRHAASEAPPKALVLPMPVAVNQGGGLAAMGLF